MQCSCGRQQAAGGGTAPGCAAGAQARGQEAGSPAQPPARRTCKHVEPVSEVGERLGRGAGLQGIARRQAGRSGARVGARQAAGGGSGGQGTTDRHRFECTAGETGGSGSMVGCWQSSACPTHPQKKRQPSSLAPKSRVALPARVTAGGGAAGLGRAGAGGGVCGTSGRLEHLALPLGCCLHLAASPRPPSAHL